MAVAFVVTPGERGIEFELRLSAPACATERETDRVTAPRR